MSVSFSQPTGATPNTKVHTSFVAWGNYVLPLAAPPGASTPAYRVRFTLCRAGTPAGTPDLEIANCILTEDNGHLVWQAHLLNQPEGSGVKLRVYLVVNNVIGPPGGTVTVDIVAGSPSLPPPPPNTNTGGGTVPPPPTAP